MHSQTQLTVDVITKVAQGKMSVINASKLLKKSQRTIQRYLQRYHEVCIQFAIHGNNVKPLNIDTRACSQCGGRGKIISRIKNLLVTVPEPLAATALVNPCTLSKGS